MLIDLSWIIGSAGTVFLDFIVLGQFYYYSHARKNEEKLVSDEEIGEN